jgi:hypothetical protein
MKRELWPESLGLVAAGLADRPIEAAWPSSTMSPLQVEATREVDVKLSKAVSGSEMRGGALVRPLTLGLDGSVSSRQTR